MYVKKREALFRFFILTIIVKKNKKLLGLGILFVHLRSVMFVSLLDSPDISVEHDSLPAAACLLFADELAYHESRML